MAHFDLKEFARRGAAARIAELHAELDSIYGAFPDLREARGRRTSGAASTPARAAATAEPRQRRRKPMSAAQKKEVSLRMKRYWAARRKAEAAK